MLPSFLLASTTKFLEARVYDWSEDQEEEEAAPLAGEQSQASVSPESEVRARALIEAKGSTCGGRKVGSPRCQYTKIRREQRIQVLM